MSLQIQEKTRDADKYRYSHVLGGAYLSTDALGNRFYNTFTEKKLSITCTWIVWLIEKKDHVRFINLESSIRLAYAYNSGQRVIRTYLYNLKRQIY